jgi:protein required for attachment to host cells
LCCSVDALIEIKLDQSQGSRARRGLIWLKDDRASLARFAKRIWKECRMTRNRTWIVIADGAHMTVMESVAGDPELRNVPDMHLSTDLPRTHELVTDRLARSFESRGRARHAIEGRIDPHRELKKAFAKRIATTLKTKHAEGRYDHLILVAPPVTLGDLRSAIAKPLRERIMVELPQDLIKMPALKLRRHLRSVLPVKLPISGRPRLTHPEATKARRRRR